jgi:CubicO group peptidase (beta-lactamase class C family)
MKDIMKGFPVAAAKRVPKLDWDRTPWNRWSFQHVREILPTVEVWRGEGAVWNLPENLCDLSAINFQHSKSTDTAAEMSVEQWLQTSYTDGFIVLHRGEVVFERYMNEMQPLSLHLSQSMSKSITATVAGILIGRGMLNTSERIDYYLPELGHTAWHGATVQQVMDMTTGVRYVEDYEALDSDIAITDIASGWKSPPAGYAGPSCIWDQILTLTQSEREHGALFQYRSIETDVLAHCMERVTETRLAELISRELWQPLGCEVSACFTVDTAGYALADGGFNATLRDYARFGQMHLQRGIGNDQQIVPAGWIAEIQNSDASLFGAPYTDAAPNGAYRNQFWIEDANKNAYMARGVFGQLIYIDPEHEMVAVKLSSWPEFVSVPRLRLTLEALHGIAEYLGARS